MGHFTERVKKNCVFYTIQKEIQLFYNFCTICKLPVRTYIVLLVEIF